MPTTYNADGTLPTATKGYLPVNIAASTNASPIVITTSGNHGFANGDTVRIEGHLVNTAADGLWQITVATATTFALNGSTGNGVGGATGRAWDYSVGPLITLPSDGDTQSVSTVNPAFEGIFNLAPYLYERAGSRRVYTIWPNSASNTVDTTFSTTTPAAATWTNCTGMTGLANSGGAIVIATNDQFDIRLTSSVNIGGTLGTYSGLALAASINGGAYTRIQDTQASITQSASAAPFCLATVAAAGNVTGWVAGATIEFALQCINQGGLANIVLYGSWSFRAIHYRFNG